VAEHILRRRARFWLATCDAIDRLGLPVSWWRWALARANAAIDYGPAEPDIEPGRRPF